jgi:hypothetical protein
MPLISETIGQRMDFAAELFDTKDSFIFYQTGERLSFRELKKKVDIN